MDLKYIYLFEKEGEECEWENSEKEWNLIFIALVPLFLPTVLFNFISHHTSSTETATNRMMMMSPWCMMSTNIFLFVFHHKSSSFDWFFLLYISCAFTCSYARAQKFIKHVWQWWKINKWKAKNKRNIYPIRMKPKLNLYERLNATRKSHGINKINALVGFVGNIHFAIKWVLLIFKRLKVNPVNVN